MSRCLNAGALLALLATTASLSMRAQDRAAGDPPAGSGDQPQIPAKPTSKPAAPKPKVPDAGDPLYAPIATPGGPETLEEKFMIYAIDTAGPRALFTPAFGAGIRMLNPKTGFPRQWRLGAGAFGRNFGNALATRSALQTGRFLTSVVMHEDFRYRPAAGGSPLGRAFHAIAFTFVDKSNTGHSQLALANFVGAASAGFVGNLYLPVGYNDLSHAEARTAFAFGALAVENILREFAPDLARISGKTHLPFPRIPIPEWWVKRN